MQIVDAVFKEGWTVPNSDVIKKEMVDESQNYYMFFTEKEGVTVDDLLDYVEGIININIEREKKYELLKQKVEELKKLFKENSLSKLERLKFSFTDKDILPSLGDMDNISIDEDLTPTEVQEEEEPKEVKPEPANPEEVKKKADKVKGKQRKVKGQNIELPPKNEKIEVEEFKEPNITCKCGPEEVCPVCEEEKIGSY
jgi:hypothetical protein